MYVHTSMNVEGFYSFDLRFEEHHGLVIWAHGDLGLALTVEEARAMSEALTALVNRADKLSKSEVNDLEDGKILSRLVTEKSK